jgi:hypothetical protein
LAAAAIVVRPTAAAAGLAIVAILASNRWGLRRLGRTAAPLAVAVVAVQVWSSWIGLTISDVRTRTRQARPIWHAISNLPTTFEQAVGSLSWLELGIPWPVTVLWCVGALTTFTIAWRSSQRHSGWAIWLAVLIVTPIAFTVVTEQRIGYIWQGRYSISTLIGLAALALASERTPARFARLWLSVYAVGESAAFWVALRRFSVGTNGSWWFSDDGRWNPRLGPIALIAVHFVLIGGVCVFAHAATNRADNLSRDDELG